VSSYELSYVALSSSDPELAADVLGNDLGIQRRNLTGPDGAKISAFQAGRSTICVFDRNNPLLDRPGQTGVDHIAFAAADPQAAAQRHAMTITGNGPESGLEGMRQARIDPGETAGVRLRFAEPLPPSEATPGIIERIDHLGVASGDVRGDEQAFSHTLGCPVESRQTDMEVSIPVESFTSDKYGVVYHNRPPTPVGGLRVLFVTVGDFELEFLQEFDPRHARQVEHGQAGTTKQDQGAIGRFIAKRGAGLHHIALKTPDIDGALARLRERGRATIDSEGRPGSRRARIGFVHPNTLGGVLMHFVEREEL
jgi:methylmalonyl-CoA epimerase